MYELRLFGTKLGLANITRLLEIIGCPHKNLFVIHIAGTNGKGSVAAMLNAMFTAGGARTGLFTSPHLMSLRERFKINNRVIAPSAFTRHFAKVKKAVEKLNSEGVYPTFFEVVTAIAFDYFAYRDVDVVLLETGMGGSYDATNVARSDISVITNVDLDHCEYLGNTIPDIARDKAGIIKQGSVFVTGSDEPSALDVFREICADRSARMCVSSLHHITLKKRTAGGMVFDYNDGHTSLCNLKTNLPASYQIKNCAVALRVLREAVGVKQLGDSFFERAVKGLERVRINARFQLLRRDPPVILDGAHNPAGILALKESVADVYAGWRVHLVLGILADKECEQMCRIIAPVADEVYCADVPSARSMSSEKLAGLCRRCVPQRVNVQAVTSVAELIEKFCSAYTRRSKTLLLICGSLYLAGDVLEKLKKSPYKILDSGNDYR